MGIATSVGKVLLQGGRATPVFLLRDDFNNPAAAPLTTPRPAEPGPGTLVITDTNSKLSIVAGLLTFATGGVGSGDPGAWGAQLTRVAGRAIVAKMAVTVGTIEMGFDSNQSTIVADGARLGATSLGMRDGTTALSLDTTVGGTEYQLASVLRGSGHFVFIKGGIFTNWTLAWVGIAATAAVFSALSSLSGTGVGTVDFLHAVDLPSPFTDDYGIATQRLAGARSVNDTFAHGANCIVEWVCTAIPSATNSSVRIRQQDSSNFWAVYMDSTGAFGLSEVVAGSGTVRANSAAILANGHRCVAVADGPTIRGYSNNVLRWTYSSASNFVTATVGLLGGLGTGGAVSDIISWPRQISGVASTLLDSAVA